jgi:hypothetical protein
VAKPTGLPSRWQLVKRSSDYDERLRRLFLAKSEGDMAFLIESLRLDPELASLSASWLADAGVDESLPALIRTLDAANSFARSAALRALEKLGPPANAKDKVIELAKDDDDRFVRAHASTVLGSYKDHSLTPLLISLLHDPEWPEEARRQDSAHTVTSARSSRCGRNSESFAGRPGSGTSNALDTNERSRLLNSDSEIRPAARTPSSDRATRPSSARACCHRTGRSSPYLLHARGDRWPRPMDSPPALHGLAERTSPVRFASCRRAQLS